MREVFWGSFRGDEVNLPQSCCANCEQQVAGWNPTVYRGHGACRWLTTLVAPSLKAQFGIVARFIIGN